MLILYRHVGDSVAIGTDIVVTIVAIEPGRVRLGVSAPPTLLPAIEEVHDRATGDAPVTADNTHINWR
jgi:carbon storage regulator CsrA